MKGKRVIHIVSFLYYHISKKKPGKAVKTIKMM
jgi:hypothetical protein